MAWRAALVGAIPSLLVLAVLAATHVAPVELLLTRAVNVATLVGGCILYVLTVGFVSGRVAHRFAYETDVSVPTLALLIAWVANLSLWGWTVVLVALVLNRPFTDWALRRLSGKCDGNQFCERQHDESKLQNWSGVVGDRSGAGVDRSAGRLGATGDGSNGIARSGSRVGVQLAERRCRFDSDETHRAWHHRLGGLLGDEYRCHRRYGGRRQAACRHPAV